jgi:hypothetical protein
MKEYAKECRDLLGLSEWDIVLVVSELPLGDPDNMGAAHFIKPNLTARIEIDPHLSYADAKVTIMHEFVHIALGGIERFAGRWMDHISKKRERELFWALYDDVREEVVERIAKSIAVKFKPNVDMPDSDGPTPVEPVLGEEREEPAHEHSEAPESPPSEGSEQGGGVLPVS